MTFTIDHLMNSLAGVLKAQYPDCPVYTSPNQQGTHFPCFFIFLMPSTIEDHVDGMFFRDLGIDIVFVQERNAVNGNAEIQAIQEYLDYSLEIFPYTDGSGEAIPLHTYERQANTEDQELHYQFHVRQRVSVLRERTPMEIMEGNNVTVKD